jgi:hypothetical protein
VINLVHFEGDHGEVLVNPHQITFLTRFGSDHTQVHFSGTEDAGIVVHETLEKAARILQR